MVEQFNDLSDNEPRRRCTASGIGYANYFSGSCNKEKHFSVCFVSVWDLKSSNTRKNVLL